ncbi:protein FAM149B1-like isoform X2 [Liolophura sinensis]|uniref:protein FAM149B1-like isoform X2 n=1 Tax=Liolophura sinensis TaxID=3198878 RepID=UPI0031589047
MTLPLEIIGLNPTPRPASVSEQIYSLKMGYVRKTFTPPITSLFPKLTRRKREQPSSRRGLAQSLDSHPTLEKPEEPSTSQVSPLSYIFEHSRDAISSYHGTLTPSGPSSPLYEADTQSTLSASNCWTTASGNTTGRSRSSVDSTYSWGDDEFDRHASKTVRNLFEEIDSMLYEERRDGPENSYRECREWVSQFPHLRVLGVQGVEPKEAGYMAIPRDSPRYGCSSVLQDVTEQDIFSTTQDLQGLQVSGRAVSAKPCPVDSKTHRPPAELSYLEEEVFAQEGEYEEILAVDHRDMFEDALEQKRNIIPRRRRLGFPPVTPNACLRDTVSCAVFDYIWIEFLEWAGKLIKHYSSVLLENTVNPTLPNPLDAILSKTNRLSAGTSGLESRGPSLGDVLTVSRKELQLREKSNLQDIAEAQSPLPALENHPNHTGVMAVRRQRPGSVRLLSATLRRPVGPRTGPGVRLTPLHVTSHLSESRSRTPSVEDTRSLQMQNEVLVGHRLPIGSDRLQSPPSGLRNSALPPLDMIVRYNNMKRAHNRASSALVTDKESSLRLSNREKYLQTQESFAVARPSTTHAFHRSDTPGSYGNVASRRSSTPLGFYTMTARQGHSLGAPNYLGVTGSGISQQPADLNHLTPENPTDSEGYQEVIHSQWSFNGDY